MSEREYAAVSIGNSTLKWCVIKRDSFEVAPPISVRSRAPQELRSLSRAGLPVYAASVNPPRLERLRRELPGPIKVIGPDIPPAIRNETLSPEQVGVDRLLAALGAFERGGPAIVVDFGTAITVDLVTEGPAFKGGAILPGPRLWNEALVRGTALLPETELAGPPGGSFGRTTEEAISFGVFWGLAGAVASLVERISRGRPESPVWVTGGAAPIFLDHLGRPVRFDAHLLFRGLAATVEAASGTSTAP